METQNYEDLFFTNDFLFCKIMTENESICKRVIKVLLGIEVEKLTYLNNQEDLRPEYSSHGIRLDVIAKDTGKVYDIEMQTTLQGNLSKRARYYQAVMDIDNLEKGKDYSKLPDSYIVFICLEDPFGGGLPRYTAKTCCIEDSSMNKKVDDKTLKVYYNASEWQKLAEQDEEVKAFLRFLNTRKPENELAEDIMEQVMYIRGQEPWRPEFMHMRELEERGRKAGYAEAQAQLAEAQAEITALKARLAKYEPVEQSDITTPVNR